MRALAASRHAIPKLTLELFQTLEYVHANRDVITRMVDHMNRAESEVIAEQPPELAGATDLNPDIQHLTEQTRDAVTDSLDAAAADPGPNLIVRNIPDAEALQTSDALLCSVCLSPIADLDKPCTACVVAGRLPAAPGFDPQADFAHLANARLKPVAHPLDAPAADISAAELAIYERVKARLTPPAPAPVRAAVPTVGNSINRAPLPDPIPTGAHTYRNTCQTCGRLPDLHMNHGGPLQHLFIALPPEPK